MKHLLMCCAVVGLSVLAKADIEAVICDAPTTAHYDILIKAARAGKHIFTEKALCPTVKECLEVKEEGIRIMKFIYEGILRFNRYK